MKKNILIIIFILISILNISYSDDYNFGTMFKEHGVVKLIIDTETGSIEYANDAAYDFYGYNEKQLLSKTIHEINIMSSDEVKSEIEAANKENKNNFIFQHELSNGDIRTVEVHSYPMVHNNKSLLYSIIIDITDTLEIEKELEQSRKNNLILTYIIILLLFLKVLLLSTSRENYKKKAMFDPLTGAYSRQYLELLYDKFKNDRRSHLRTWSLVEIDLDRFKSVNDNYGHKTGDKVLVKVVEVIKDIIRDEDIIIRFGGDEFLVLLEECSESEAIKTVNRISDKLKNVDEFDFPIEFSYGIVEMSKDKDLYKVIELADEKMYYEKQNKRR